MTVSSLAKFLLRKCVTLLPLVCTPLGERADHAVVRNPRNCSTCRECLRSGWRDQLGEQASKELKDAVVVSRIKDHFICLWCDRAGSSLVQPVDIRPP